MSVEVVAAGLLTLPQDLGRKGVARLGVPPSGALDEFSARSANRLVGNDDGAAVLECLLRGPALRFCDASVVAVVGAPVRLTVDGAAAPTGQAIDVAAGGVVEVGTVAGGLRCWLAVAGGFDVPVALGSRSADPLGGLGPSQLRPGDRVPLGRPTRAPAYGVTAAWPGEPAAPIRARVVDGPHAAMLRRPVEGGWTVTPRSDRTGLRLAGESLRAGGGEVASCGLVAGAVQVPPDGQPVVLLAGHQATGGYPVGAVVCAADLPLLAQARPGTDVVFERVDVATARAAYAERLAALVP